MSSQMLYHASQAPNQAWTRYSLITGTLELGPFQKVVSSEVDGLLHVIALSVSGWLYHVSLGADGVWSAPENIAELLGDGRHFSDVACSTLTFLVGQPGRYTQMQELYVFAVQNDGSAAGSLIQTSRRPDTQQWLPYEVSVAQAPAGLGSLAASAVPLSTEINVSAIKGGAVWSASFGVERIAQPATWYRPFAQVPGAAPSPPGPTPRAGSFWQAGSAGTGLFRYIAAIDIGTLSLSFQRHSMDWKPGYVAIPAPSPVNQVALVRHPDIFFNGICAVILSSQNSYLATYDDDAGRWSDFTPGPAQFGAGGPLSCIAATTVGGSGGGGTPTVLGTRHLVGIAQ